MSENENTTTAMTVSERESGRIARSEIEVLPAEGGVQLRSLHQMRIFGHDAAQSRFYPGIQTAEQAMVKLQFGFEMGFRQPAAILAGVHIIEGRPSMSVHMLSARIRASGKYRFAIKERTVEKCVLEFFERDGDKWLAMGESEWTMADATRAGLANKANWKNYPRAMLYARALGEGARVFCSDLFFGVIYTEEESADVRDDKAAEQQALLAASRTPELPAATASTAPALAAASTATTRKKREKDETKEAAKDEPRPSSAPAQTSEQPKASAASVTAPAPQSSPTEVAAPAQDAPTSVAFTSPGGESAPRAESTPEPIVPSSAGQSAPMSTDDLDTLDDEADDEADDYEEREVAILREVIRVTPKTDKQKLIAAAKGFVGRDDVSDETKATFKAWVVGTAKGGANPTESMTEVDAARFKRAKELELQTAA